MTLKNIAIVSAWGRGAWLAHQLQQSGFHVTILDVSSLLPSVSSLQREGPFGVFLPSHLSDLQKQYLLSDNFYSIEQGFSVYTSAGAVEFQGPLYSFLRKKRKDFCLLEALLTEMSELSGFSKTERKEMTSLSGVSHLSENIKSLWDKKQKKQIIEEIESSESLVRLALELGSSYFETARIKKISKTLLPLLSTKAGKSSSSLGHLFSESSKACSLSPLFSDYFLREASQRYFAEVKNSLQTEGVQWLDISQQDADGDLKELEFTKKCVRFRLKGEKQEVPFLIWALSGPETVRCFSDKMPVLFPKWKEPLKIWRPFSLSWDRGGFENVMPSLLVVLPSAHQENNNGIISLKKHKSVSHIDMWILCPYSQRFDEQALSSCLDSALNQLRVIFPHFSISGFLPDKNYYQEYYVQYESHSFLEKKGFYNKVHPRLFHLNPESTGKVDAYSLMQQSNRILKNILSKK